MSIKETDRKARANYRKKVEKVQFDLYPSETAIKEKLNSLTIPKATYIKNLIKKDIETSENSSEVIT